MPCGRSSTSGWRTSTGATTTRAGCTRGGTTGPATSTRAGACASTWSWCRGRWPIGRPRCSSTATPARGRSLPTTRRWSWRSPRAESAGPVLGPPARGDEQRLAVPVDVDGMPHAARIDHGQAGPELDLLHCSVDLLEQRRGASELDDQFLAGRVPFPRRPGGVGRADHDEPALVPVARGLRDVALEVFGTPLEVRQRDDPGTEAQMGVGLGEVEGSRHRTGEAAVTGCHPVRRTIRRTPEGPTPA